MLTAPLALAAEQRCVADLLYRQTLQRETENNRGPTGELRCTDRMSEMSGLRGRVFEQGFV